MHGIVSLLDEVHSFRMESLWMDLAEAFGTETLPPTPIPHFSYHVADTYDVNVLRTLLTAMSCTRPFTVRTAGLGIFNGQQPVLYIPIVRTARLSRLHRQLWRQLRAASSGTAPHWHPQQWIPHITVAYGEALRGVLPEMVRLLSDRPLEWQIEVTNVAYLYDGGQALEVQLRHEFCGRGAGRRG